MGNAESRLQIKSRFEELCTSSDVGVDSDIWKTLLSPKMDGPFALFNAISPADVRRLRDAHPENLETLVKVASDRVAQLALGAAVGPTSEGHLLNNIRILTRIFPLLYESPSTDHQLWLDRFLWGSGANQSVASEGHGHQLLRHIYSLMFFPGFTLPLNTSGVWAAGIATAVVPTPTKAVVSNRIEVLRLLLAILSQPMYNDGDAGLQFFVSSLPQNEVIYILCSLVNTALQHTPAIWNRPFEEGLIEDKNGLLASLCMQVTNIAIVHLTKQQSKPNLFRMLLSKIHRESDCKFLIERLLSSLDHEKSIELAGFLWELLQCNESVRRLFGDSNYADTSADVLMKIVLTQRHNASRQDAVRLTTYILLYLSANENWASRFAHRMLPQLLQMFSDVDMHVPVLLDIYYNIAPFAIFSPAISEKALEAFHLICTSSRDRNELLLTPFMQATRVAIESHPAENKPLVWAFLYAEIPNKPATQWLRELAATNRASGADELSHIEVPATREPSSSFSPICFRWGEKRLRWYLAVLWGSVYQLDEGRDGLRLWANTGIKLFNVDITEAGLPSLKNPRGAVDAVADVIIKRLFGDGKPST